MKIRIPEKGSKELRKGRFSQKEAFYFVTTSCCRKQKLFLDKENVQIFLDALDWIVGKKHIDLHFCIVMPDHVHLVFQLTGDKALAEVVKTLKQFTGRRIKQRIGTEDSVWQEQYYDHLIRKDESLSKIIEYCWYNPVRAGIVDSPKEYPYWKSKYDLE
jgi:REP element-mobilizing transposase RayT